MAFDWVVEQLGGLGGLAELTGRSRANVCQWRKRLAGRFPASTYIVINDALRARGVKPAPWSLFKFELPPQFGGAFVDPGFRGTLVMLEEAEGGHGKA